MGRKNRQEQVLKIKINSIYIEITIIDQPVSTLKFLLVYINFLIPRISIINVACFVSPKTCEKNVRRDPPGRTDCDCLWARSPLHGLMMVACRHRWFFPMEQTLGCAVQPWKLVVGHGGLVDNFWEAVGASLGIPGCREELKEKITYGMDVQTVST